MPQTRSKTKQMLNIKASTWDSDESDLSELSESENDDELATQDSRKSQPPPKPQASTSRLQVQPTATTPKTRASTQKRTQQTRKKKGPASASFLPTPAQASHSLDTIFKWLTRGALDLEPDYQRDVVWKEEKQILLIESVWENYFIPPILCALSPEENGISKRTCIDGKQRLTSIMRFMRGEIPYKDGFGKKWWWTSASQGKGRRNLLPEDWKLAFEGKTFSVADYRDITVEQEREISHRVQMGVSLTQPERLQAVNGELVDQLRKFRELLRETDVFAGFGCDWGKNKGKDFCTVAQVALLIKEEAKREPTLPRIEGWLQKQPTKDDKLLRELSSAFGIFCRIIRHAVYGKFITKTAMSPQELVYSIYLIVETKKKLTDCQTADAIRKLREAMNEKEAAKSAATMFKAATDFYKKCRAGKLSALEDNIRTKSADVPLQDFAELAEEPVVGTSKGKKRAHAEAESHDENAMDTDGSVSTTKSTNKKARLESQAPPTAPAPTAPDEDSESDPDVPLSTSPPTSRRKAAPRAMGQPKPAVSAATTRLRKPAAKKPISKASTSSTNEAPGPSRTLQTAKSASHPSLAKRNASGVKVAGGSTTTTPQIPAASPPIQDVEMQPPPPTTGTSTASIQPQLEGLTLSSNAMAKLRASVPPPQQQSQSLELPASVHKLPTPPAQEDQHMAIPGLSSTFAPPPPSASRPLVPQHTLSAGNVAAGSSSRTVVQSSSSFSTSAPPGSTFKGLGLKFNKKSHAQAAPAAGPQGPPPPLPSRRLPSAIQTNLPTQNRHPSIPYVDARRSFSPTGQGLPPNFSRKPGVQQTRDPRRPPTGGPPA